MHMQVRLGEHTKYRSAGTVEFLVDDDTGEFYFLEVHSCFLHACTAMLAAVASAAVRLLRKSRQRLQWQALGSQHFTESVKLNYAQSTSWSACGHSSGDVFCYNASIMHPIRAYRCAAGEHTAAGGARDHGVRLPPGPGAVDAAAAGIFFRFEGG